MTRLREHYVKTVVPSLMKELGLANGLAVPRLSHVVVSMGVKAAVQDRKRLDVAVAELGKITGQKPAVAKARQSISGFRLREGMEIGCFVTLRGSRMYEFLDRVVGVVLPRVRDFRGLRRTAFDGRGNFSFGLTEQGVFPEIEAENVQHTQGMNITVVTTAGDNKSGLALLSGLGFPFEKNDRKG